PNSAMYMGSRDLRETFGTQLIAGRDFTPEERIGFKAAKSNGMRIPSVILSRALAERLFHGKNALGQNVYVGGQEPQTGVGVFDRIARPNQVAGEELSELSMFLPVDLSYETAGNYILRVAPERRDAVIAAVDEVLYRIDSARIIQSHRAYPEI